MEKIQIGDLILYKGVNFNQIEAKTELGEAKIFIDCFSLSKENRLKIAKMNAKDRKYDLNVLDEGMVGFAPPLD